MRSTARGFLASCLFIAPLLSVLNALSLSDFQPVRGFPTLCTNAYSTPLPACSPTDFTHGRPCSQECIKSLDKLTTVIIAACKGTKVDEHTLIGSFFVSQGTAMVCPNVLGSKGSGSAVPIGPAPGQPSGTSIASANPSNTPSYSPDSATAALPTKSASGTTESTSSTSVASSSASAAATSTLESTGSSSVSLATSTLLDSTTETTSTATRSTIPLSLLTAASTSASTDMLPVADSTTSSSKPKATHGGGGGTPFDVTSSSSRNSKSTWIPLVSTSIAILLWVTCMSLN